MKRAVRIFFHGAAAISGVLLLLAIGFWGASYGATYSVTMDRYRSIRILTVSRGEVGGFWLTDPGVSAAVAWSGVEWRWKKNPPFNLPLQRGLPYSTGRSPVAGFLFYRIAQAGLTGASFLLPVSFLVALFAPLPLVDVLLIRRRRRRRRRLAAGMCVRCGYDLRATPQKCPECGDVPAAQAAGPPRGREGDGWNANV